MDEQVFGMVFTWAMGILAFYVAYNMLNKGGKE